MDPEAQQAIAPELAGGERLLWAARPRQGLRFRASDALLIPFSLLWAGFAVFWELTAWRTNAPGFFLLWGIPFVLMGLYITVGRFFLDSFQRSRTFYGVTDQRAIIVSGVWARHVKSLPLRTLADISLAERGDGSGTITLGPSHPAAWWYSGFAWPGLGRHLPPAFELIDDARRVHNQLRDAQRGALGSGA